MLLVHLDSLIEQKGEQMAVREMRSHAPHYVKGIRGAAKLRNKLNRCENREQFVQVIDDFVQGMLQTSY